MLSHVARFIKKHNMLPAGSRVLVGVSGGMDSVALLHALCALRGKLGIELEAAHFNHGIRGESAEEAQFVTALCRSLDVRLSVGCAAVPELSRQQGVSLEVAARQARHGFFRQVMAGQGITKLALAHHMDDQAETVLLRLIRGTGTDGLGAMAPVEANGIVRPLLCVGREQIHAWCIRQGYEWREDASNVDRAIARNWVRHELMPLIRSRLNPSASAALCRAAELMRQDGQYLNGAAAVALQNASVRQDGSVSIPAKDIAGLHAALLSRALRLLLKQAGLGVDVEQVNIEDIAGLLADGNTGCRVDLDGGYVALREASALVIAPSLPLALEFEPIALNIPGETAACGGMFVCEMLQEVPPSYRNHMKCVQYFDADAIPTGVVARGRQPGDRFHPLGAAGGRKLKEYLIDRKVSRFGRDGIPLIAHGSEVLWVVGHAISNSVRVTENTIRVLKISFISGEGTI